MLSVGARALVETSYRPALLLVALRVLCDAFWVSLPCPCRGFTHVPLPRCSVLPCDEHRTSRSNRPLGQVFAHILPIGGDLGALKPWVLHKT